MPIVQSGTDFDTIVDGANGLLPFLEAELGTDWGSFQVKRAGGESQGFRPGASSTTAMGKFGTGRITTQELILGFMISIPVPTATTQGDVIDANKERMKTAVRFRSSLDGAILKWAKEKGMYQLADQIKEITGPAPAFEQRGNQSGAWQCIVVRRFDLVYLEG